MDKRVNFFLVFAITFVSVIAVAFVSWLKGNSMLHTVLYSLATMWIMGIVSQLLIHNLYLNIVKPIEQQKMEEQIKSKKYEINADDIEDIDSFVASQDPESGKTVSDPVDNKN